MNKRQISMIVAFSMLLSFFSVNYSYGEVVENGRVKIDYLLDVEEGGQGYKLIPYESKLYPNSADDRDKKPTALFSLALNGGNQQGTTFIYSPLDNPTVGRNTGFGEGKSDFTNAVLYGQKGDVVTMTNLSTARSLPMKNIHVQQHSAMFPVLNNTYSSGTTEVPLGANYKTLNAPGEYRYYLYAINTEDTPSDNGNHWASGASSTGSAAWRNTFFKQYFTALKVVVPSIQVQEVYIDADNGFQELEAPNSYAKTWGESYTGTHKSFSGKVPDGVLIRYSWDSTLGYNDRQNTININVNLDANNPNLSREEVKNRFDSGRGLYFIVTYYYKNQPSSINVDFDVIHNSQNVNNSTIRVENFPLTINLLDKSTSQGGTINGWNWTRLNTQTYATESFSSIKNPTMTFVDEAALKKYLNSSNQMTVSLEARDTANNIGTKTRTINFNIVKPDAMIVITGSANAVNIPYGATWAEANVNFTIRAAGLSAGETILEWNTEVKTPRNEALGYRLPIKHDSTTATITRALNTDVSHTNRRVWLKAELKTNYGIYYGEGYVDVPTSQLAQPPIPIIEGPTIVSLGDKVTFDGTKSYSPDPQFFIEAHWWEMPAGTTVLTKHPDYGYIDRTQSRIEVYFTTIGQKNIEMDVWNNQGVSSRDPARHTVMVTEPYPVARITVGGTLKENRMFTLDSATSTGNDLYPIDNTKTYWTIAPAGGQSGGSIKVDGSLTATKLTALMKEAGDYRVRLYVENTYGNSDVAERIITIAPDESPIVVINAQQKILRNPDNQFMAKLELRDDSYSNDSDTIAKREWFIRYDSNNDGIFEGSWTKIGEGRNIEYDVAEVGNYEIKLFVKEEFGQPTIAQFVTPYDRRSNEGLKAIEVINTPPIVTFEAKPKPVMDILVNAGDSKHDITDIKSAITEHLEVELGARGIDYKITYADNKTSHNLHFYSTESYRDANNKNQYVLAKTHIYTGEKEYLWETPYQMYDLTLMPNNRLYFLQDKPVDGSSWYFLKRLVKYYDLETGAIVEVFDQENDDYNDRPEVIKSLRPGANNNVYIVAYYYGGGYGHYRRYIFSPNNTKTLGTSVAYGHGMVDREDDFQVLKNGFTFTNVLRPGFYTTRIFGGYMVPSLYNSSATVTDNQNASFAIAENTTGPTNTAMFYKTEELRSHFNLYIAGQVVLHNGQPIPRDTGTTSYPYTFVNHYLGVGRDYVYMRTGIRINVHTKAVEETPLKAPVITTGTSVNRIYGGRLALSSVSSANGIYNLKVMIYDEALNKIIYNNTFSGRRYSYFNLPLTPNEPNGIKDAKSLGEIVEGHVWRENSQKYIINIDDSTRGIFDSQRASLNQSVSDVINVNAKIIGLEKVQYEVNAFPAQEMHVVRTYPSSPASVTKSIEIKGRSNNYKFKQIRYSITDSATKPSTLTNNINIDTLELSRNIDVVLPRNSTRYLHYEIITQNGDIISRTAGPYSYRWDWDDDDEGDYSYYPSITYPDEITIDYTKQSNRILTNLVDGTNIVTDNLSEFISEVKAQIVYDLDNSNTQYILVGEEMQYDFSYEDRENDPKYAERWKYTHDPSIYENSLGQLPNSGQWFPGPITKFLYTGLYHVLYQGQDNPKNDDRFDNYRLWSLEELSTTLLYVHRRPIAKINYAMTNYNPTTKEFTFSFTSSSYDLDHQSKPNRGIALEDWSWIKEGDIVWNTGKPTTLKDGNIYTVRLRVRDLEGVWSYYDVVTIDVSNLPPVVAANPDKTNGWYNKSMAQAQGEMRVNVEARAFNGRTIEEVKHSWSNSVTTPSSWTTVYQDNFNLTQSNNGIWYLHLIAKDSDGKLSENVVAGPYLIDKLDPTIDANPQTYKGMGPLNVTITATDTGGSGLSSIRYRWTQSAAKPSAGWTTLTQSTATTSQDQDGIWYLHMEATDNAGNSYYRNRSYEIDGLKVSATLLPNPAMAGDQLIFTIDTEGYAERLEIFVDPDIMAMDKRVEMGYQAQTYPLSMNVNGAVNVKTNIMKYTLWVTTDETLDKNNYRLRAPYKFVVRAWRGTNFKEVELELEVKGDIRSLIRPGIKNKN